MTKAIKLPIFYNLYTGKKKEGYARAFIRQNRVDLEPLDDQPDIESKNIIYCQKKQVVNAESDRNKPKNIEKKLKNEEKLLLIDGSNLLARSYFATSFKGKDNLMRNKDGLYTNGVHVFVKKLLNLIKRYQVGNVCVCWDEERSKTFRREMFSGYKALRDKTEPELKEQFDTTKEVLKLMNVPQQKIDKYEADDIIGTFSEMWRKEKEGIVLIYSNDKDLYQLLDEKGQVMQILSSKKQEILFTASKFEENYGVNTGRWIDVKALLGETGKSSDNIPGCKGVGEKAAYPLIKNYQTIENLYENLENLDPLFNRYKRKLKEQKENVLLSKKLVTIAIDIPQLQDFKLEKLKLQINQAGMKKAFRWLDFRTII